MESPGAVSGPPEPSLSPDSPELLFNRELSWVDFNERVLEEAERPTTPLLERAKFVSIFWSNLDEFFMVRVSGVLEQQVAGVTEAGPDGLAPSAVMAALRERLVPLVERAQGVFTREILPGLAREGVQLVDYLDLAPGEQRQLRDYFDAEIFPVCTPLAIDPSHPFPLISNLSLNLAVVLHDPERGLRYARVKVPNILPRIIPVPGGDPDGPLRLTWLEQVLAANLSRLFPGMEILEVHPFRVVRDADIEIQELEAADLLEMVEETVSRRRFGFVCSLALNPMTSTRVRTLLAENLRIAPEDVIVVDGPLGLADLMELQRLDRPDLKDPPWTPRPVPELRGMTDPFPLIRERDVLLHHPFQSFGSVVEFVERAAVDPDVLAIKMTLYRVGKQSPIVQALMEAAAAGKQVAVLVELKARFDEENNIEWARQLEQVGVHVTYGLVGLKTHCKLALVVRRDRDGLRRYVHIGTGNYNPSSARLYTDMGILTCDPEIAADVTEVFNVLTGYSRQTEYRRLLVAPASLRSGLQERIDREIELHRAHGQGRLIFKMNSLADPEMIRDLYRASQAGVQVDLLVRGICCLRPGIPGVSEHIRVRSIVGRFLEHSRIFWFANGGDPEVFIGSADLMQRNLDHRVEVLVPVLSGAIRTTIRDEVLARYLRDTTHARELGPDGRYRLVEPPPGSEPFDSQAALMAWAHELEVGAPG